MIGVRVSRFESRDHPGLADVIPAEVDEWLRLEPNHLDLTVSSPGITS